MVQSDPKQVILEELHLFEHSPSDLLDVVRKHGQFIRPIKYTSRLPHGARMASVHFRKEASIPGYQIHALTFDDTAGIWWRLYCFVVQDTTGNWYVEGCSGIAGNDAISRPSSSRPKITLSGASNGHFYAGGSVIDDNRLGIVQVRLFSNGELIGEDTLQDDMVVFVNDRSVHMPVEAQFYTSSGECVGVQQVSFVL